MEYPKTENLYASNGAQDATYRRGPEFGIRAPGVEQIKTWLVTEKVDGMNMRVVFYPFGVDDEPGEPVLTCSGRSAKAQIPGDLLEHLREKFTVDALFHALDLHDQDPADLGDKAYKWRAVFFGEGFGPGIQKAGHAYGGEKRFILFDVVCRDTWLNWTSVCDIAVQLNVPTVPALARGVTLGDALTYAKCSELLPEGSEHIEGIVARTDPYLFDGRGKRVMFKYKVRDL